MLKIRKRIYEGKEIDEKIERKKGKEMEEKDNIEKDGMRMRKKENGDVMKNIKNGLKKVFILMIVGLGKKVGKEGRIKIGRIKIEKGLEIENLRRMFWKLVDWGWKRIGGKEKEWKVLRRRRRMLWRRLIKNKDIEYVIKRNYILIKKEIGMILFNIRSFSRKYKEKMNNEWGREFKNWKIKLNKWRGNRLRG